MYNNNNHVDGNESTPDRCAQLLSFTIQSHPVAHSEFLRFSYIKTIPKVDLYLIFQLINWFLLTEIERKFSDFVFVCISFWIEISLWLDQQSGLTIFSMLRITGSAGHARPYLFWRSECAVGCCRLPVYLCAWPIMRSAFFCICTTICHQPFCVYNTWPSRIITSLFNVLFRCLEKK